MLISVVAIITGLACGMMIKTMKLLDEIKERLGCHKCEFKG
jgi:hypothetical protein